MRSPVERAASPVGRATPPDDDAAPQQNAQSPAAPPADPIPARPDQPEDTPAAPAAPATPPPAAGRPEGPSSTQLDRELGRLQARTVMLILERRLIEAAERAEGGVPVAQILKDIDEKIGKDLRSTPLNQLIEAEKYGEGDKLRLAKLLRDVASGLR